MTIRELIEELQGYDEDLPVAVAGYEGGPVTQTYSSPEHFAAETVFIESEYQ